MTDVPPLIPSEKQLLSDARQRIMLLEMIVSKLYTNRHLSDHQERIAHEISNRVS